MPSGEVGVHSIRFVAIRVGQSILLKSGKITVLPAEHAVPAVGYLVDSGQASFAFSGDTTYCEAFWESLEKAENLRHLMIEATFLESSRERAKISGHMTPALLARGFERLGRPVDILITHMEAGREEETMQEILALSGRFWPKAVSRGQVFEF